MMPAKKSKFTETVEELCREEWNLASPPQDWALKENAPSACDGFGWQLFLSSKKKMSALHYH
jgi:hypothetical protein